MPSRRKACGKRLAERPRLVRQQVRRALDENHLAAEATNGLRHLDADRPAAEHEQPAGHGLHAGRLAVRPNALEAAQARHRRDDRVRTCRHDHVSGRVANAVDLDHARAGQPAATAEKVDAVLGEPALLASVGVVRNHEVAPGEGRRDVDLRCRRRRRSRHGPPPPGAAASWTGCTPSRSTRRRRARARRVRRADRPRRARRRSARPASRRR